MFSGILIGGYLAFWVYMIFCREKKFDHDAFKLFMFLSGAPFIVWCIYRAF